MIGILGFAGTGKDTVAELLGYHGYQRMAFADPLKRVVMELFDFTYEQMWGTLAQKEAPDPRYPRLHDWIYSLQDEGYCACCGERNVDTQCYLNGRYALKIIGTEGARRCWDDVWVSRTIKDARLIEGGDHIYSKVEGVTKVSVLPTPARSDQQPLPPTAKTVVFTDCRFKNEVKGILDAGGKVYRIRRPGYEEPAFHHASETEQLEIPDASLNGVIYNDGTIDDLERKVLELVK
jgi:hypothetical protein